MISAKQEAERLIKAIMPLAEQMLAEYGEFHPYGGAIDNTGEIIHIGAKGSTDHPPSQELIEMLETAFREGAKKRQYVATALVCDMKVEPPGLNQKTDAISIRIDHFLDYSVEVFFPYEISNGKVYFGKNFAHTGKGAIFERHNN